MNKEELYLLRRRKKILLKAIAADLDISIAALSQYENDKMNLTSENERKYKQYILNN